MSEIELIDNMILRLKALKSAIKQKEKLSNKLFEMNHSNSTEKQIKKMSTDLNWNSMAIEKAKTEFARIFKNSFLDVDTGEKEYKPSSFQNYRV